jgi:hypothetical protein
MNRCENLRREFVSEQLVDNHVKKGGQLILDPSTYRGGFERGQLSPRSHRVRPRPSRVPTRSDSLYPQINRPYYYLRKNLFIDNGNRGDGGWR